MPILTVAQILQANRAGLLHLDTPSCWSYPTPALQVAYVLGRTGQRLGAQDVVGFLTPAEGPARAPAVRRAA